MTKEGPNIIENYKEIKDSFIIKQWMKPIVYDSPAIIRGPPKILPISDNSFFLKYLEFELAQKKSNAKFWSKFILILGGSISGLALIHGLLIFLL